MILKKFALFLVLCTKLSAFYVGNTAGPSLMRMGLFNNTPSWFGFTSGYLGDFALDKKLKTSKQQGFASIDRIDKFEMESNFGVLGFNLLERMEINGYFGVSKAKIEWDANSSGALFPKDVFTDGKTKNHFAWAASAKIVFLQWGATSLGADFKYFTVPTWKATSAIFNPIMARLDLGPQYFNLHEWQAGLGLSTRLGPISPYVGGKYMQTHMDVKAGPEGTISYKNRRKFGLFVGLSLSLGGKLYLNGEARFFDEEAFSASSTIAF